MQSELTVEQQFKLKVLENHIQGLSKKQLQKLFLLAVRQVMTKNNGSPVLVIENPVFRA